MIVLIPDLCNLAYFHYQHYLSFVRVKNYRQAIARLRCSSHRLEIEAGGWHKPVETENVKDVILLKMNFTFCLNVLCIVN